MQMIKRRFFMNKYTANAGQTYMPVQDNIHIDFLPYTTPAKPSPLLKTFELKPSYIEKGFIIASQKQHFLPGLTAQMLDWFWANMEKGYYLWAPGSHKRFSWVKSPAEVGMDQSIHMIAESCAKGAPVFGGEGVQIHRLSLDTFFPFTDCLSHVICEGVFNDKDELVDSTVYMWEDTVGGINHITFTVVNTKCSEPPAFIKKMLADNPDIEIVPNYETDHDDYEASQWPVFLPTLYNLWKNHPDPSQNVQCCLQVEKDENGQFHYVFKNGPVKL